MSTRLEWLTADATVSLLIPPGEEAPDGQIAEMSDHYTLVLSHGDSGGTAIEGTPEELRDMLSKAMHLVRRAAS